jgi:hypothetical protein
MSLWHKLLGRRQDSPTRTRVCVECGMPLDQHKPWCAIWQAQQEMAQQAPTLPTG